MLSLLILELNNRVQAIYSGINHEWNAGNGKLPRIILSIIGTCDWEELDDDQIFGIKNFQDVLYSVAADIGAWIISDADFRGIGRVVGTELYICVPILLALFTVLEVMI